MSCTEFLASQSTYLAKHFVQTILQLDGLPMLPLDYVLYMVQANHSLLERHDRTSDEQSLQTSFQVICKSLMQQKRPTVLH